MGVIEILIITVPELVVIPVLRAILLVITSPSASPSDRTKCSTFSPVPASTAGHAVTFSPSSSKIAHAPSIFF